MACVLMGTFFRPGDDPQPHLRHDTGLNRAHCTGDYRKRLLTPFPKELSGLSRQPIHPDVIPPPCLRFSIAPLQSRHHLSPILFPDQLDGRLHR
jgi:hypothetical protein